MPQRSTESDQHRNSILQRIYEVVFGHEEAISPRMQQQIIAEQTARNNANREAEIMQETKRKVRELTGRDFEIIPQTEADNRAKSIISAKNTGLQVGSKDAERIVKSIRRHGEK